MSFYRLPSGAVTTDREQAILAWKESK